VPSPGNLSHLYAKVVSIRFSQWKSFAKVGMNVQGRLKLLFYCLFIYLCMNLSIYLLLLGESIDDTFRDSFIDIVRKDA
jgi:hypothetical protein